MQKNNFSISLFLIVFSIVFNPIGFTQTRIASPYSYFAVGDIQNSISANNIGMGGVKYAYRSPFSVNYSNPASYSAISKGSFVFDGSILSSFDNLKTNETKKSYNYTCLNQLLFGFPITKWWKSSFGLIPISRIGYKMRSTETDSIGYIQHLYEGSGGLNQFYIGNAFRYKDLSVGVNSSYLFGYLNNTQTVYFPAGYGNYRQENNININKIFFTYGLQYEHTFIDSSAIRSKDTAKTFSLKLKRFMNGFTIGFGLTYNNRIKIISNETSVSGHPVLYSPGVYDTINTNLTQKAIIKLPRNIGAGIVLRKENVFLLGFDYQWTNWSEYYNYSRYSSYGVNDANITNNWSAGVGLELYVKNKYPLRLGYKYISSYLHPENQDINTNIVTLGFGMPFYNKTAKSVAFINLGLEMGKFGTRNSDLTQDSFIRATIGITIFEKWFTKSKYF